MGFWMFYVLLGHWQGYRKLHVCVGVFLNILAGAILLDVPGEFKVLFFDGSTTAGVTHASLK